MYVRIGKQKRLAGKIGDVIIERSQTIYAEIETQILDEKHIKWSKLYFGWNFVQ